MTAAAMDAVAHAEVTSLAASAVFDGTDGGGGAGRGTGSSNNYDAAAAKANRHRLGELCLDTAIQQADETARIHVTKRAGARAGQARGGSRTGHGGARYERTIRLARRRAEKTAKGGRGQGGRGAAATAPGPREEREASVTTPPSPTRTPHRTYLSQRNRSSITRGAVGHSIPLVEGRRALRGAGAEPERLATRAWGMSGPVRIQEQNRTESE